ncbi:MAG: hypothetical protein ACI9F9_003125 [Candidatus Paceibacteria bacterium]|jgi:hypothetical protein
MQQNHPYPAEEGVISIGVGIILVIVTCGLYAIYWQYKQMQTLNAFLGREEYDFMMWLLLGLVTCGLFTIYYEYRMANGINEIQEQRGMRVHSDLALICLLLAIVGLGVVSIAIQQADINEFYGESLDF